MKKMLPKVVHVHWGDAREGDFLLADEFIDDIPAGTRVGVYELKNTGIVEQATPKLVLEISPRK
jgi:hypothetical protein